MTNQALLYRSNSRSQLACAFATAAVFHIGAIALASHQSLPGRPEVETAADVEYVSDASDQLPPPEEIDLPVPPDVTFPNDFWQEPMTSRPVRQAFRPIRRTTVAAPRSSFRKSSLILSPRPDYPYECRSRHITGSGVAVLTIDQANGSVVSVSMIQTTGNLLLDHAACSGFRGWRFQPGTEGPIQVPITFTLSGAQW